MTEPRRLSRRTSGRWLPVLLERISGYDGREKDRIYSLARPATFPAVRLATPPNEKRTVVPRRRRNSDLRTREFLTEAEVERLIEAAKDNRWGHRNSTMLLIAFRHGLRASEVVDLRCEQIDLENAILHVRRVKQGTPATHPLTGRELRALRRLQREQEPKSPFVFVSERGDPFSTQGFQAMVERAGKTAGFGMKIHPHMLRHSCGYKLANDGVDTRTRPLAVRRREFPVPPISPIAKPGNGSRRPDPSRRLRGRESLTRRG